MLNHICVTGATGFVGSHFVRAWQSAHPGTVHTLVRPNAQSNGEQRLFAALETARRASGEPCEAPYSNIDCLEADVCLPLCGLTPEAVSGLRTRAIDTFWHFASDLRFEAHYREQLRVTNVEGAGHALDLAVAIGAKRFVYISTAYVCGRAGGLIEEHLSARDQGFSNDYEASKAQAEQRVVDRCQALGLALTILRPSIVLGPRKTKSLEGAETGLFSLVHAVLWIKSLQSRRTAPARVAALPEAEINFVPVDCVVSDMMALAHTGFGDQMIYHLTSRSCPTVSACWQALSSVIGLSSIVLVEPGSFDPSPIEHLVVRRLGFFMSYLDVERTFVRSLTPHWSVDARDIEDYVKNAVALIGRTDPLVALEKGRV